MIKDTQSPNESNDWVKLARDCYELSTSYVDANWRKQWERNISLFQSKHPTGSKYNSEAFKARSKFFRPKTRAVVRKNEAAAAAAFFSNVDVLDVQAENENNPEHVVSAILHRELLNYRLTKTVPWFITLLGAFQEAQVIGVVASYQYWDYKERVTMGYEPITDDLGNALTDAAGQTMAREVPQTEVLLDKPCIELIPVENIRFSPSASWTNIVESSPYIIRAVPMYLDEVRAMMDDGKWTTFEDGVIRAAMQEYDTTRQARERGKQDPQSDSEAALKDFDIIWCHENFIRKTGKEYVYWTLGTEKALTEPVPLKEAYWHGKRPIVIGTAAIEAHRPMPDSLVAIGSELQKEANDLTNQRMDNVKLVLNKRWFVKRGAQVDSGALMRNVPGGAVMVDDVETSIKEVSFADVTGSSYQEQDRLNIDFDSLVGNFDQSSVQTNRQLNETVGGMNLASGGASLLTEYLIRTFVETWVEPVLRQLVDLEKFYETDQKILDVCGGDEQLQQMGVQQVTPEMLGGDMSVTVNVGMGATDPQKKLGKFMAVLGAYAQVSQMPTDLDPAKLRTELFGLAGYKNSDRFVKQQGNLPPAVAMQIQQMQAAIQQLQQELQSKTEQARIQAEATLKKAAIDATTQIERQKMVAETAINVANIGAAVDDQTAYTQARTDLGLGHLQASTEMQKAHLQASTSLKQAAIGATQKNMDSERRSKNSGKP